MSKNIDLSSIRSFDIKNLVKKYTHSDILREFERLLNLCINKQPLLYDLNIKGEISLFDNYYVCGTNIKKQTGHSRGGRYSVKSHQRNKIVSVSDFLNEKHSKESLLNGIYNLCDYEHLINVIENRGGASEVTKINNATLRRDALSRYGEEKFFKNMNAKIVDERGKEQLLVVKWHDNEDPIKMAKVIDPSTRQVYLLRVPPDTNTLKEASSWLFWMTPDSYRPIKET